MDAADRPSGLVTFLFTEIQGSTRLWERYPDAMAVALARHDAIMREAIASHHGYVFKTIGDAFCAAFPTASDGLAAAVEAQRALQREPWGETGPLKARMALHSGIAEERDGDYFGPPVNRVARLLSAGHGGQVLVSGATQTYLNTNGSVPAEGVTLRDMGEHRLKDLAQKELVYQVVAPDLPATFPRLKSLPPPATGAVLSLATSAIGLILYQVGAAGASFGLSLLNPLAIFQSFKGLMLELASYNELLLLAAALTLLTLTLSGGWVWSRTSEFRPGEPPSGALRFAGQFTNLRLVTFLAGLFLIVSGAFVYQQYLWRVALPIPDDAIGIALTREASAASVKDELADALFTEGQSQRIVVRELPVRFDATDISEARRLGKRVNAEAVVIYRADEGDNGETEYVAYVVFTDPTVGIAVSGAPERATLDPSQINADNATAIQVKESVDVPRLETTTLSELIDASAGIIAYGNDRSREAISHLELAVPDDPSDPSAGIVNFFLGSAYALDYQDQAAAEAFERAITHYEGRIGPGERLGPQDSLILVKSYLGRGRIAGFDEDPEGALDWYERALDLREDLVARSESLERPSEVHGTYARLFAQMADIYRFQGDEESQRFFEGRARDEANEIVEAGDEDDPQVYVQQSSARLIAGDCVGAEASLDLALGIDPTNVDALYNLASVQFAQGRPDLAEQALARVLELRPDDIAARQQLSNLAYLSAIGNGTFIETAHFDEAERINREILELDPTNLEAHQQLADLGYWHGAAATVDLGALMAGDNVNLAKSQILWPNDPERRQVALDAYGEAITERRILATELRPDDPDILLALAAAYFERQRLIYAGASHRFQQGDTTGIDQDGEQVLADAEEIHRWTASILEDGSEATTLQRLRAYDLILKSYDREWGWYEFFEQDAEMSTEIAVRYRETVREAETFLDSVELTTDDEQAVASQVYFDIALFAVLVDGDDAALTTAIEKSTQLSTASIEADSAGIQHSSTTCAEEREAALAEQAIAAGDHATAIRHYEAALAINPEHVLSLNGLSWARYRTNRIEDAVVTATRGTEVTPDEAALWSNLGLYAVALDNTADRDSAYQRFFATLDDEPGQTRIGMLRVAVADLRALLDARDERAEDVRELIPTFRSAVESVDLSGKHPYEYASLHAELGTLAVLAGDVETGQALLARAVEIDAHQPAAKTWLALAQVAQGDDATGEIESAVAEASDPLWTLSGLIDTDGIVNLMLDEIDTFAERFPEHVDDVADFRTMLEGIEVETS